MAKKKETKQVDMPQPPVAMEPAIYKPIPRFKSGCKIC
jgi:hypothetical protein